MSSSRDDEERAFSRSLSEKRRIARARKQSRRQSTLAQELNMLSGHGRGSIDDGGTAPRALEGGNGSRGEKPQKEQAQPSLSAGGIALQPSQRLVESNKLEDQINLQHLVELMRIFHVRQCMAKYTA